MQLIRMLYPFFIVISLMLSAMLIGSCQSSRIELHSLTQTLITSGTQFDPVGTGQDGFNTYAKSPNEKAFAASMGRNGKFLAWGKA